MKRLKTRRIKVGSIFIGDDFPVAVQSMTNTDTRDVEATVAQISELKGNGCDIVRCAVPDEEASNALKRIVEMVDVPVVADIHFDYRLALDSIENGVSALRINPGNIGDIYRVKEVAKEAKKMKIPIRIGVNSGSLKKDILDKYGKVCAEALVESALEHVRILENVGFYDIVISIKSSNVAQMVESYRKISKIVNYPLHLGVTEAGTVWRGTIKSAAGIGTLLMEGIGDTIRVSLTGDPVEEVRVGKEILKSCGLLKEGIEFISCPTCGRTEINLIEIAKEVENRLSNVRKNIKVAVMGCVVNGPGEAREADIGIAGGKGEGLIFKKGSIVKKVKEKDLVDALIEEVEKL
ncbi:flavodoxin-dependent (E)-4-hydroxy-3-methylbut-2-enyl-diphosphate synthase [Clostridium sp. MT-14]|jgi:(E)-4-hydroxy-3-methylbut-2-enyl-diphosphate synthase|uniref:4-hydroxy-3-methylbut-2-en-1-yl diphosphate synthase (flavodoxin) n=1 Tax=Clostridium aromativorans TaxID=2836848 RepID=A0ABS8N6C2_9CLOT|nr:MULTISPECIES: flavodoxin-dependent (E)-4-hydroxy-3-methylbut-2-enyl-diphosphate synthase [Clostridium]KAA8675027.1 flavodoxin-dependent (E)-4-hydroxy-3-methylbut-2-enyl-diphosphate synthase [Clostridium sp. HV4-5-A1G]MCC9294620.1 flavodoxin-dependent (E)-4-hydroxy-3-methylbut-2-enyl-diphosphate synthase [Clostridium aromativorans]CAB1243810.1 4-hydroxy-3-methylbut-2-en-1-yl diphosphate synthase (1-hydroxy-2-methyl-2-(E)-butenyl 4-diphosphate synthase) [Clostridiaceae bacterium BL-3]